MALQIVLNLAAYLIFVGLGYWISQKMDLPQNNGVWMLWIVLVVMLGGICVSAHAININDILDLHVNEMLQAVGIGILIGFVLAKVKQKKQVEMKA
jgi:hypothetical protein